MIHIDIKESEQLPGLNNAFVFSDTFDYNLVQALRALRDRKYNGDTKTWEIPVSQIQKLLNQTSQQIQITYKVKQVNKTNIPKSVVFKTKPFEHQIQGIEYGLAHNSFLLADEPGLGKTLQVANIAVCRKHLKQVRQVLVVCCVNSIKYNWEKELHKHTNETCFVLGSRVRKNGRRYTGSIAQRIEDIHTHNEFFLITNMESLRNEDFVNALLQKSTIDMVVVDECHFMRNPNIAQTKGFLRLNDYKYKIAMSGTPIVNNPLDAYTTLFWLGFEKSSFYVFRRYYCNIETHTHSINGYRNLSRLRESMSENMLRRLKKDVLDLPEKIEKEEYLEMSDAQWGIYDEVRNNLLENIDLIAGSINPLAMLTRLRQATADTSLLSSTVAQSVKFDRIKEIVYEHAQNNEKCIIFSSWTQVTSRLKDILSEYNPAYITGEVNDIARTNEEYKFQNDDSCKVCIGTMGAMGTGLTFTRANTAIFVDLPWHKAAFQQCCDRVHRISQERTVTIISLICSDTIDERILDILYRKGEMSDILIDGKISKKISKQMLLSLLK